MRDMRLDSFITSLLVNTLLLLRFCLRLLVEHSRSNSNDSHVPGHKALWKEKDETLTMTPCRTIEIEIEKKSSWIKVMRWWHLRSFHSVCLWRINCLTTTMMMMMNKMKGIIFNFHWNVWSLKAERHWSLVNFHSFVALFIIFIFFFYLTVVVVVVCVFISSSCN